MLTDAQRDGLDELLGDDSSDFADLVRHYVDLAEEPDPALADAGRFERCNRAGAAHGGDWLLIQRNMIGVFRSFDLDHTKYRALIAACAHVAIIFAKGPPTDV